MNSQKIKLFGFISLVIVLLIVLITPLSVRHSQDKPLFAGGVTYYNIRVSEDLSNGLVFDTLQQKPYEISFFHYLIYPLINLLGLYNLVFVLVILGLLSLYLFYLISDLFFEDTYLTLIACLVFVFSPLFIYIFTNLTSYTFATLFFLCFVYLFLKENNWSILFLSLLSITHLSLFILTVVLLLFTFFYRKNKTFFLLNLIPSIVILVIYSFLHQGFLNLDLSSASFSFFFISLGAISGIAFFYLFLGVLGLLIFPQRKRYYNGLIMSVVFILLASLFSVSGKIILNFYLSIFSAYVIIVLIRKNWEILTIKRFTLLLIFCGIIFSTVLYTNQLVDSQPTNNLEKALIFLKIQPSGNVFSYKGYGYFIEYFSNKTVFMDGSSDNKLNSSISNAEHEIFFSRQLKVTEKLLQQYNIKYFLITSEMKSGLVWMKSEEGLLFLLENTNLFNKTYDFAGVEVWTYANNQTSQ